MKVRLLTGGRLRWGLAGWLLTVLGAALGAQLPVQVAPATETVIFSGNEMLRHDDPVAKRLRRLYDAVGLVFPAYVFPLSVRQALELVERLERGQGMAATLSGLTADWFGYDDRAAVLAEAGRIRQDLESCALVRAEGFAFDAVVAFNPELYLHSRPEASGGTTAWEYGYAQRNNLLELQGRLAVGPFFGALDLDLRSEHNAIERSRESPMLSNIPADPAYVDFQFPYRAFLSVGDAGWNFALGRDRVNVGSGVGGNLGISGAADWYDFARFQLWGDSLRYTGLWLNLDASLDDVPQLAPPASAVEATEKNAFLHRLDIAVFDKFTIGLAEAVMVGGQTPGLKLFNPFILFHDTYPWLDTPGMVGASSLLEVDATANPFRWLRLWGQFAMNQFQTEFERQKYPGAADAMPDAYGWLAGAELTLPLWVGTESPPLMLGLGGEYCLTNPWLYVRENGYNSWFTTRRLTPNMPNSVPMIHQPIGWRLGPDSRSLNLWFEASVAEWFQVRVDWERREQGENGLLSSYAEGPAAVALAAPSGVPELTNVVGLSGDIWFLREPWLGLEVNLDWVSVENADHGRAAERGWTDWQFAAALRFAW